MEVPLEVDGKKVISKVCFAQQSDFLFAKSWKDSIGTDQNPVRTDTVEYAELAVKRYEASFGTGIYANSLKDFSDHVASNPKVEVGAFVVLRCSAYPDAEVIGFSHFRRTWCNKIVLDYLGTHPLIARPTEHASHAVRGVGVALLYFISRVLKQEGCLALWGEATSSSATYYQKVFELEKVEDLILASRDQVFAFAEKAEQSWSDHDSTGAVAEQSLQTIYALEVANPPFVGSKMALFNQSKRLAYRFLRLPYHKQLQLARELKFIKGDSPAMSRDQLAEIVFKEARKTGTLAELWTSVEKEYADGLLEPNPFEPIQET